MEVLFSTTYLYRTFQHYEGYPVGKKLLAQPQYVYFVL